MPSWWIRGPAALAAPFFLVSLLTSSEARAADGVRRAEVEPRSSIFGIKAIQENIVDDGVEHGGGVGLFAETPLVEGWLEVEANGSFVWFADGRSLPFELLAKKTFRLGRNVTPYAAVGPTVSLDVFRRAELHAGGALALGTYVWWSERWGLDVDMTYARFVVPRVSQEVTVAVGSAYRF